MRPSPFFKQFGPGLAAAILIDAAIVRAELLPASMRLLGEWNWYLPPWLQWLPRLGGDSELAAEVDSAPLPRHRLMLPDPRCVGRGSRPRAFVDFGIRIA